MLTAEEVGRLLPVCLLVRWKALIALAVATGTCYGLYHSRIERASGLGPGGGRES